jgi:hypothetical protein
MRRNYFEKPITKRFIDAFPKFEADEDEDDPVDVKYFWETWQNSPFYLSTLSKDDLQEIYNHLLAAYYNWHYVYMDDLGIALNTMHIIHDYYPNCKERLTLVAQLRGLTVDDFAKSGIQINSQGANPKTATDMDELIDLVDSQNASFQLRSTEGAIRAKFNALYDGVMDEFIGRFKDLFVKLYNGVNSYIYQNPIEEEGED